MFMNKVYEKRQPWKDVGETERKKDNFMESKQEGHYWRVAEYTTPKYPTLAYKLF